MQKALHFYQILIYKIAKTPYYIVAKVYPHVSWVFSSTFPLLLVPRVEDET
jgi:hypothetical protein